MLLHNGSDSIWIFFGDHPVVRSNKKVFITVLKNREFNRRHVSGWSYFTFQCAVVTLRTIRFNVKNSTFYPHSEFTCSLRISEQRPVSSSHINRLVFKTEEVCLLRGTNWTFQRNADKSYGSSIRKGLCFIIPIPLSVPVAARSKA